MHDTPDRRFLLQRDDFAGAHANFTSRSRTGRRKHIDTIRRRIYIVIVFLTITIKGSGGK